MNYPAVVRHLVLKVVLVRFHIIGYSKSKFHGLVVIQSRIDLAFVGPFEIGLGQLPRATNALGNIVTGQFQMYTTKNGSMFLMNLKCDFQFIGNFLEASSFDSGIR